MRRSATIGSLVVFFLAVASQAMAQSYRPLEELGKELPSAVDGSRKISGREGRGWQMNPNDTNVNPNVFCNGSLCTGAPEDENFEDLQKLGERSSAANVLAPLTGYADTTHSEVSNEQINTTASSDLGVTFATWAMVEPGLFSAISAAAQTGIGMTANRYHASAHTLQQFDAAGEGSDMLKKSYASCMTAVINGSGIGSSERKTYAEAQEICLGGRLGAIDDTAMGGTSGAVKFTAPPMAELRDAMSFRHHPDHPFNNPIAADGAATGVDELFTIHLSDLLFNKAIEGAMSASTPDPELRAYLVDVRNDWRRIIGDVRYDLRTPGSDTTGSITGKFSGGIELVKTVVDPIFDTAYLGDRFGGNPADNSEAPSVFSQYRRARTEDVYNELMKVMKAYCEYRRAPDVGKRLTSSGAVNSFFADETLYPKASQKMLSFRGYSAEPTILEMFYKVFEREEGESASCDLWDYAEGKPSNLKYILDNKADPKIAKQRFTYYFSFAYNIAFGQFVKTLDGAMGYAMKLNSGSFESKARRDAIQLISDSVNGMTDFKGVLEGIAADIREDVDRLAAYTQRVGMAGGIPKPNVSANDDASGT